MDFTAYCGPKRRSSSFILPIDNGVIKLSAKLDDDSHCMY